MNARNELWEAQLLKDGEEERRKPKKRLDSIWDECESISDKKDGNKKKKKQKPRADRYSDEARRVRRAEVHREDVAGRGPPGASRNPARAGHSGRHRVGRGAARRAGRLAPSYRLFKVSLALKFEVA